MSSTVSMEEMLCLSYFPFNPFFYYKIQDYFTLVRFHSPSGEWNKAEKCFALFDLIVSPAERAKLVHEGRHCAWGALAQGCALNELRSFRGHPEPCPWNERSSFGIPALPEHVQPTVLITAFAPAKRKCKGILEIG